MKEQKREIPIYSDDKGITSVSGTVLVDSDNVEWLTPVQTDKLEDLHYLISSEHCQ